MWLVADTGLLGGAHAGNAVLVAARHADHLPERRLTAAGGPFAGPFAGRVLRGAALDRFIAGAPADDGRDRSRLPRARSRFAPGPGRYAPGAGR